MVFNLYQENTKATEIQHLQVNSQENTKLGIY